MLSTGDNFSAQIIFIWGGAIVVLWRATRLLGLDTFPRSSALRNWLIDEHIVVAPSPLLQHFPTITTNNLRQSTRLIRR